MDMLAHDASFLYKSPTLSVTCRVLYAHVTSLHIRYYITVFCSNVFAKKTMMIIASWRQRNTSYFPQDSLTEKLSKESDKFVSIRRFLLTRVTASVLWRAVG